MKNNLFILSLLAILVIVLLVFVYMNVGQNASSKTYEREVTKIETVSESNDVESIEEDLNDTDLDNIDSELTLIEAELN